ncbi:MAG: hypothetical protein LBD64_00460 [Odoribacteraceae bacterium]|jgi:hypothetical protein|nr:hypothetical protein [Odoribacteraceae bacterium]
MTDGLDWILKNHLEFHQQLGQGTAYIFNPVNLTRMGFKAGSEQETWVKQIFAPKVTAYTSAYNDWLDDSMRTPTATSELLRTENEVKALYRQLYTGFLKNSPFVTDEDLKRMGMPERFTGPKHPAPVAKIHPASRPDGSEIRMLKIHFGSEIMDGVMVRKGKPAGQAAAIICHALSSTPLTRLDELVNSDVDTNSPFVLSFSDEERGMGFYYSLCWLNRRGEKGPFGPIMMAIVP